MDNCTKTNILYAILGIIFGIVILFILFAIVKKIDIIGEQNNRIGEDTKIIRAMLESNNIRYELNK